MNIVFIGTVDFSLHTLSRLIDIKANVVGVCTKRSSKFNNDFADLTPLCIKNNIPYHYTNNINSVDSINWIKDKKPDVIFCFGWSSLIKKELLELTSLGVIGYHPASLPQNRGRHPIIWALALGLEESASTFFFMGEGADDGDIISQKKFNISYDDTAEIIYSKLKDLASSQIEDIFTGLKNNNYEREKQNHSLANVWRKRGKEDGKIDFRMSSNSIYNLVRSLTKPYVGAHIEINNESIVVWKAEEIISSKDNIEPGKVIAVVGREFVVKCSKNAIKLIDHEFITIPKVGDYL